MNHAHDKRGASLFSCGTSKARRCSTLPIRRAATARPANRLRFGSDEGKKPYLYEVTIFRTSSRLFWSRRAVPRPDGAHAREPRLDARGSQGALQHGRVARAHVAYLQPLVAAAAQGGCAKTANGTYGGGRSCGPSFILGKRGDPHVKRADARLSERKALRVDAELAAIDGNGQGSRHFQPIVAPQLRVLLSE